jgi:hypothetical protein
MIAFRNFSSCGLAFLVNVEGCNARFPMEFAWWRLHSPPESDGNGVSWSGRARPEVVGEEEVDGEREDAIEFMCFWEREEGGVVKWEERRERDSFYAVCGWSCRKENTLFASFQRGCGGREGG